MTERAAPGEPMRGRDRISLVGVGVAVVLAALVAWPAPWVDRLQSAWFDLCQAIAPRQVSLLPVTVVEIDQKSLAALGQWPWPRTRLARLVSTLARADAAAIGVDILMPEADALSPERVLAEAAPTDGSVAEALRSLLTNDAVLASALASAPTVLVVAGTSEPTGSVLRAVPVTVQSTGIDAADPKLATHAGALASLDELNRQASGWGLISVDTTRGIVRRVPLVASIQGTLVPTLAVEMLRVAYGAPTVRLAAQGRAVTALSVGEVRVRTEADAAVRPYFSRHRADRFVSAVDVLDGKVGPALLRRQLVLIGPTALGLEEFHDTPLGDRMSGSEIQAQLLENLIDGTSLRRPAWASGAEAVLVLLAGTLLAWMLPRRSPRRVGVLIWVLALAPLLCAFAVFRTRGLLLDAATPVVSLLVLFGVLLMLALTESLRQRRSLERVVQTQREQSARIAGELEAAQRIQSGSLPRADLLRGDARVDLFAALVPAREVGGDLYDFFRLDDDRLFLLIGDVAGKGLSASIFMAVSKALYKGTMLRAPRADIGAVMSAANAEVSRDNAEMLFVTMFAAVLDLRSGELAYCNAGHDNPYRLAPGAARPGRIVDGDGPPLCARDDFDYRSASVRLVPGEMLCLTTDGVAEAQDASGALYGHERVEGVLAGALHDGATARALVETLQADVLAFEGGAEPHDDLTILALRWNGPSR